MNYDFITKIKYKFNAHIVYHKEIAIGFFIVFLFSIAGKVAGAAKEIAIAWRYGISEAVDAYIFLLNIISWPVSVWFSIITMMLVPIVSDLYSKSPEELPRFRAEFLGLTILVALVLMFVTWWGLPYMIESKWIGISQGVKTESFKLLSGMGVVAFLGIIISTLSVFMIVRSAHINSLYEAIPAIIILFFLLFGFDLLSAPLLWGTVIGYTFHWLVLSKILIRRKEINFPSLKFSSPKWSIFSKIIVVIAIGQALMGFTLVVDQIYAAKLNQGDVATLGYANRIIALFIGLGAVAIARAALPIFSQSLSESNQDVFLVAIFWVKCFFIIGVCLSFFVCIYSNEIVKVLFHRGMFDLSAVKKVSDILEVLSYQIPFYFSGTVLMQYLVSKKKYFKLVVSYTFALAAKFLVLYLSDEISLVVISVSTVAFIAFWMFSELLIVKLSK